MWPWLAYLGTVVVWFMATYSLARLSYTYLEKPLMRRGRREQAVVVAS